MTTGQSYKGFDRNNDSFSDMDPSFCMTDVMIELYHLSKKNLCLPIKISEKGIIFCFINALLGPCFDETPDTVIFSNYASLN